MRKTALLTILFSLLLPLFLSAPAHAIAEENITVYGEYLTDANGYNYGCIFYVDSSVNEAIYVRAFIVQQDNVTGDVISGILLADPNEKHVKVGSFIATDQTKPWSVKINAQWKKASAIP